MSFLDNLENNLKAMEGRDEGGLEEGKRRDLERAAALAAAPWAEKLKSGEFTKMLMGLATRAGFARKMKVQMAWIGTALRLEARGGRLELRPTPKGVEAVFTGEDGAEIRREPVNPDGDPGVLVERWMQELDRAAAAERARVVETEEETE